MRSAPWRASPVRRICVSHAPYPKLWIRRIDGDHTISEEINEVAIKGLHRVEVHDEKGGSISVILELGTKRIHILRPIGKQTRYPALDLAVIRANERDAPKGRKPIE
jgi:hypothetical protein